MLKRSERVFVWSFDYFCYPLLISVTKLSFPTLRRHSENVHELFYLQSGGNMMDYPVWKKKTKTPQFLAFHKANQLDTPKAPSTSLSSATSTTTCAAAAAVANSSAAQNTVTPSSGQTQQTTSQHRVLIGGGGSARMSSGSVSGAGQQRVVGAGGSAAGQQQQQPHGAEIKIPGVGVTPVAVSTTLPAAVVQLSQQGRTRDTKHDIYSWFLFQLFDLSAPGVCAFFCVGFVCMLCP